jgi:Domain of unknown function (DUF222)
MVVGAYAELIDAIDSLSPDQRAARLAEIERTLRRLEAETAVLVRAVERDRGFRSDGHLTAGGFLRAELRWSTQQVTARRRLATLVSEVPAVIEHLHTGTIGVAQAHAFGRAAANPRCGGQLADHADVLLESARTLSFDAFHTTIATWERLADADGANRDAAAHHDHRRFDLSFFDGVGYVFGHGGALDYTEFSEIVEQYRHAEWLADWEQAEQQYGVDVVGAMLARTDAQRSWDALMRMARDAVSTPAGAQPPEPVVNLCITIPHAEAELARLGLIHEPSASAQPPLPDQPVDEWRCGTTDGRPLSPFDVAQAMLHGRIRRVVFDSAGVVVDFGRLQRLFDGAARKAVLLQFPTCIFPGCIRPASHCDADHLTDWQYGGATNQDNGGPMCSRHNRLKNRGFTVWRDPNGVFHTYRPDGTEIAPAPPPPGTSPPTIPEAA